ncbi:MAG: hypothetical protein IJ069_03780 [Prevotella sp.]|nr:hypothetical protein [Prevotella sp.]
MIELPLDRINAQSPYEVSYAPNGDFVFATSLGIHYLISFESEEPVGGCATFQFVIQKLDQQHSPHDAKVEKVILAILEVFFTEHLDVLLYMCDDSDGREANRNRFFWHGSRNTLLQSVLPFALLVLSLKVGASMLPLL